MKLVNCNIHQLRSLHRRFGRRAVALRRQLAATDLFTSPSLVANLRGNLDHCRKVVGATVQIADERISRNRHEMIRIGLANNHLTQADARRLRSFYRSTAIA